MWFQRKESFAQSFNKIIKHLVSGTLAGKQNWSCNMVLAIKML